MKRAAWASLPPSSRLALEPSVDLRDNELNKLQSQSFSASPAVPVGSEPIPSSLLPLVSYLFLLPSILFLLLMLNFPIHSQGNPLPAVWKPQQSNNLLLNEVLLKVEKGNICGAVYLDLTKAFDIVDHEILMSKLSSVGVSPPVLCSGFLPTWLIKNSRNPLWQWIIRSSSRYFRGSTRKHLGTVIVPYVYQRATCCYWILRGIIVCWRYFSLICLMLRKRTSTAGEQVESRSLQLKNVAKSEQNYIEPFKDQIHVNQKQ